MDTSRRLPPLSQLRAFEAAARHTSFKQAAAELSVTPAAISHQVRELEARLGYPLFVRQTRQVVLTTEGLRLYRVLRDGFDAFAETLQSLSPNPSTQAVTLTTTPAFASQCLLHRLPQLQALHPEIELRVHASDASVDLALGGADLAIRYGDGPWPDHEALKLMKDELLPVSSPALQLRVPQDLQHHRLIHFDWLYQPESRPTWRDWLHQSELMHDDVEGGLRFSECTHAIQAAIAGQGVALINRILVGDAMKHGLLESPFGPALDAHGWTLLRHQHRHQTPAQTKVWDWIAGLREELA